MNPQQLKNIMRPRPVGHKLISGLIFLVFGLLLIAKLAHYPVTVLEYIPERVLYWIAGVGSAVGGLFMMYKTITRSKIVV